jgi:hypothetical protein
MVWLTVREAAVEARRHPETVAEACRSGELHGSQRKKNASWRIEDTCLEAWVRNELCTHRQSNVTPISAARTRTA